MLVYPQINPIALQIGPLTVYWYGLMYLFAIFTCWGALVWRVKTASFSRGFDKEQVADIIFYAAMGIILGGRIGYMLFYSLPDFLAQPLLVVEIWKGGMSFHGGMLGVIIALWLYSLRIHKSLIELTDFIAPVVPIGLALGRIGNFINGELWGRITSVPWAMVFPRGGNQARHPSQLYECLLEGVLLFGILWTFSRKPRPTCAVSGLFLIGYGICRFGVEFFRQPDEQKGFVALGWLTEGQLLSLPMLIVGTILLWWAYKRKSLCNST